MSHNFSQLYEFIERAVNSRKYSPSSARAYRVALKLFEEELNDEEKASVDLVKKNIIQIQQQVFNKNKKLTPGSLATYRSRITKVIGDFEKHGTDATKMANWNPKVIVRKKRNEVVNGDQPAGSRNVSSGPDAGIPTPANMHKIELALRPDAPVTLVIPRDLKAHELVTITAILESLTMNERSESEKKSEEL